MKSASELAEEILDKVDHFNEHMDGDECLPFIAQALTEFAEQASLNTKSIMNMMIRKARADALEEAAKVCDSRAEMRDECDCRGYTRASEHNADEIRAMKDKP